MPIYHFHAAGNTFEIRTKIINDGMFHIRLILSANINIPSLENRRRIRAAVARTGLIVVWHPDLLFGRFPVERRFGENQCAENSGAAAQRGRNNIIIDAICQLAGLDITVE